MTDTTRTLLNHWFGTDHRLQSGSMFRYHHFQREAIETLIYLYEVVKVRRHKELLETFVTGQPDIALLNRDDFARYSIKMATGSGKTKVMALAVAWHYFNAVAEGRDDFAKTFLVIAPNVIVFERLRLDFEGGRVFRTDPIIPPPLSVFWDMSFFMRGDAEGPSSQGSMFLTNIDQLYGGRGSKEDTNEPADLTAVLGPKPPTQLTDSEDFCGRILARDAPCLVVNDEAHHTHDEENEWNKVIRTLNADLGPGITSQLDFSATPRYAKGGLFTWTVFDYPLKQAILDSVVKRPMKGVAAGMKDQPSDVASVRYRAYLTAGVERWREYRDQLKQVKKKPIMFVMMNTTADAEDVGEYLRTKYPEEFGDEKLLIIHTNNQGQVSKKDLDRARAVARQVDEGESPVNAIVSVLMLREGWDVQSVTVVVGLRPFTASANILPEQAIGRGLRLMFRGVASTYVERVDVIGNGPFLKFIDQLEKDEDIAVQEFDLKKDKLVITTIFPAEERMEHDIAVPVLSPILSRKKTLTEEIAGLDVSQFQSPVFPESDGDAAAQRFKYEGYDIISLQKLVERDYTIPQPQTAEEVISYYSRRIANDVKLPSQFSALAPKVREFLETKAFGNTVELGTPVMIRAISTPVAQYVTIKAFSQALRGLVIEELAPELLSEGRKLSETPPFPYSRPTFDAKKCVFNLVPCDNQFERDFAEFLENAKDVVSFAKLPSQFGFFIEYTDSVGNLRFYEPDFVCRKPGDQHLLVETKGREDVDVAHKDRAAAIWCENATLLTGTPWTYFKVPQTEYRKLSATDVGELELVFAPQDLSEGAGG
ncbi:MAG: DEAD/DEAH box helicase family protein [Actinomycetota bacterium]